MASFKVPPSLDLIQEVTVNIWFISTPFMTFGIFQDSATFTLQSYPLMEQGRIDNCINREVKKSSQIIILQAHNFSIIYKQQFLWLIRMKSKHFLVWA